MGILFFNWYGYQLLTQYWQHQAETHLQASLDKNEYDESQLLKIRIPVTTLAYYNYSQSNFERVDGKIDIHGVQYQYVKRRFVKDSLELLCIPNEATTKLQQVKNDFFRQVNDLQQQTQGQKSPFRSRKRHFKRLSTNGNARCRSRRTGRTDARVRGLYLSLPSFFFLHHCRDAPRIRRPPYPSHSGNRFSTDLLPAGNKLRQRVFNVFE